MTHLHAKISQLLVLIMFHSLSVNSHHIRSLCSNQLGNYTSNSTFKANLNLLLPSLSPNAAGFSNDTQGQNPDQVYGLVQCRGDVSADTCRSCLDTAIHDIVQACPNQKAATIWYHECLLRYSNKIFFSSVYNSDNSILCNKENVSDPEHFNSLLGQLMGNLTEQAANSSTCMFATGDMIYANLQHIYGLVQCTEDLSREDCDLCLTDIVAGIRICDGKTAGQGIGPSCYLQYELESFYGMATCEGSHNFGAGEKNNTLETVLYIVIPVVAVSVLLSAICIWLRRRRPVRKNIIVGDEQEIRGTESLLLDLGTLKAATNKFSDSNKLGEGGFGPVYKGTLPDGEEIAVKRLSRSSMQGFVELKNEVDLVAKLQHRNLVRLLGCCIEEQEMLLVYEYLPNTSLDKFLYDPVKHAQLDWGRRYRIIEGIGRGLLYLHEDSRLKIIHRDLKASNILLDGEMNPKISDFGLAKLFSRGETQGATSRIAGTYGYMAPEYAMHGRFSTKSDVFSYGVLVLEIVTGRRNSGFCGFQDSRVADIVSYVWQHWSEGTALHVTDQSLAESSQKQEVLRCIHIGLLCVQEDPEERPSMALVTLMLCSNSVILPAPSVPAFFVKGRSATESDVLARDADFDLGDGEYSSRSTRKAQQFSVNEMYNSEMEPR